MIGQCPAITLVGDTSVSGSLVAMNCQIEQSVEIGYNRLFGSGGAFGEILTVSLTIYIALLAYGFLTGRTRLTLAMMSPRLTTMVLVLTFVTFWPAYHTVFYSLFMEGPDKIVSAVLAQKGSAVMTFAQNLDQLFERFAEIAKAYETRPGDAASVLSSHSVSVTLYWLSGMILLLATLGLLILTRLVLYLLLILGPVFILLALFNQTRGLFNGWLRTVFVFAAAPMLTVLGGNGALMVFAPLIAYIGEDPARAADELQPMMVLFMGSVIYATFLLVLIWVAASLARDWHAALRDKPADGSPLQGPVPAPQQAVFVTNLPGTARRASAADILVSAGVRSSAIANAPPDRLTVVPSSAEMRGIRFSRVRGLGQQFRSPARVPSTDTRPA